MTILLALPRYHSGRAPQGTSGQVSGPIIREALTKTQLKLCVTWFLQLLMDDRSRSSFPGRRQGEPNSNNTTQHQPPEMLEFTEEDWKLIEKEDRKARLEHSVKKFETRYLAIVKDMLSWLGEVANGAQRAFSEEAKDEIGCSLLRAMAKFREVTKYGGTLEELEADLSEEELSSFSDFMDFDCLSNDSSCEEDSK